MFFWKLYPIDEVSALPFREGDNGNDTLYSRLLAFMCASGQIESRAGSSSLLHVSKVRGR